MPRLDEVANELGKSPQETVEYYLIKNRVINVSKASRDMNVPLKTLQRAIERMGIDLEALETKNPSKSA